MTTSMRSRDGLTATCACGHARLRHRDDTGPCGVGAGSRRTERCLCPAFGLGSLRWPKPDRRVEGWHDGYPPDTGCHVEPSCLACSLPRCIYDQTDDEREVTRLTRDLRIARDYQALRRLARRPDIRALAARHGVSVRTVHRAVARLEGG